MTKQEQETLQWYQDAVEVLNPLRGCITDISIRSSTVLYSEVAVYVPVSSLESAEKALSKAEEFFTKQEVTDE